jgi:hypothetical protein
MKKDIEDWFKREIDKLSEEGQETTVGTIQKTVTEENKKTTTNK